MKPVRSTTVRSSLGLVLLWPFVAFPASGPTSPVAWGGKTEIAAGHGIKGPWQQNDSRYDYVDDGTVAISERGEILVAWVEQARKDVYLQRLPLDGRKPLGGRVNVSRSPATFSWLPRIAVAPDAPQHVYLLWQEIIFSGGSHGGDILFARSGDGGETFDEPVNLSRSIGGDGKGRINRDIWHNGSLDIVAGSDGVLYAAWTEYDGPLWLSRSTDGGRTFSRPRQVAGDSARPVRGPSLALGANGTVHLAWTVGEDDAADIHVARSDDGGATFSQPQIVAPSGNYSDAPKLAVDSSGTVHLVYAESTGGPFERYEVRYTRAPDGRTFAPPRVVSKPASRTAGGAAFPALGIDAQNNVVVLWESYPTFGAGPQGLGVAISCGDRPFTPPAAIPDSRDPNGGTNGSHQGRLMNKLAVSRAGHIAVVNSSLKQGAGSHVWLIRGQLVCP